MTQQLAKLKIAKITNKRAQGNYRASTSPSESFTCQFNPETFQLKKSNKWDSAHVTGTNMAALAYKGGLPQSMSISLTFDTTSTGDPVFEKYNVLRTLAMVDETTINPKTKLGSPPWVLVQWGTYIGFAAVIESLTEDYLLFKPDGTPIRAKVTIALTQVADAGSMDPQNPTSRSEARRTWVVEEGQRLDWIAYSEYGESGAWREIADANGIDDPFNLRSGQVLNLPARKQA